MDGWIDIWMHGWMDRIEKQERERERHTHTHTDTEKSRQREKETERETQRERERQRDRETESLSHLSVHQWLPSAIHESQQLTSPIGFLS